MRNQIWLVYGIALVWNIVGIYTNDIAAMIAGSSFGVAGLCAEIISRGKESS